MKSLNVKKVAAATAGIALLGAAALGAVDMNSGDLAGFNFFAGGEPNVKIVVGSKSMPSDAVAAAKLAATIGNLAWTYEDITVLNTDLLECTGGGSGTGGSVTAEVTTPGVNPDVAFQMKTYVAGFLDYDTTDDRTNDWDTVGRLLPTSNSVTTYAGRRVTNFESALAQSVTISDSKASDTYTQEEKYYVFGSSYFDTNDKRLEAKTVRIGYESVFSDPIPVCTNATPSATTCSAQYETDRHNVKVKFLGADWVIYGLDSFEYAGGGASGTGWTGTPLVTLGKSVSYQPYMSIGDTATTPNGLKIVLEDISGVGLGAGNEPKCTFKIYDADDNEIDTSILQVGGTSEYNDNDIIIKLFDAATGQAGTSNAEVQIFSEKLELQHTKQLNTKNTAWVVNIVGGGSTFGASLQALQITNAADQPFLAKGDSMPIINDPQAMKLSFNGLDETNIATDQLTATLQSGMYLPTYLTPTQDSTSKCNAIYLKTDRSNGFQFGADSGYNAYVCVGSVAGEAKLGSIFYYKNGVYVPYNSTSATVNVTIPTSTAITLTSGGNWTLNITGETAVGVNNCTNTSGTLTAFAGTTAAAGGTTNSTHNVINAAGTAVTLYNEIGVQYHLVAAATYTVAGTTQQCNASIRISTDTAGIGAAGNGTITGFTLSTFLTNYFTYNYGPNSVSIGVNTTALMNGAITGVAPLGFENSVLYVPEYITTTDTAMRAFKFAIGDADGSPAFLPSSGTTLGFYGDYAAYTQGTAFSGASNNTAGATVNDATVVDGFISWRGSKLTGSSSTMTIEYPTYIKQAIWTLSSADADVNANTAEVVAGVGEYLIDNSGYKVQVKKIGATASGGACDLEGVNELVASSDKAFVVTSLDTTANPLVVLDSAAPSTKPLIVVGGQLVNTVAADLLSDSAITPTTAPMVKVMGDKILVAGWAASDTMQAADSLNGWLKANGAQLH
ncbi:MAG: S-layer protein [Candidatus Micrarchaeota archaeon]